LTGRSRESVHRLIRAGAVIAEKRPSFYFVLPEAQVLRLLERAPSKALAAAGSLGGRGRAAKARTA
jgi:hypothetical protein